MLCFFLALFAIAAIGTVTGSRTGSAAKRAIDSGQTLGMVFWLVILGAITARFLKTAKASASVTRLADGARESHQFFLSGKHMTVTDPTGNQRADLTFKLTAKQRAALLDVPRATVDSSRT